MPNKNLSVRVRMYRQGLGDCFLLTFRRDGEADFNMMIDCGLFQLTKNGANIMKAVARDIKERTKTGSGTESRVNAVVLTHEHWDHISGFSLAKTIFDDPEFIFDEVWVGWTENADDPKVREVRERFEKKKTGLRAALTERRKLLRETRSKEAKREFEDLPLLETADELVNGFFGEEEQTVLGMSGADTWKFVMEKSGLQPPRYCTPGDIHTLNGFEGVRVYVLGPPEDFEVFDDEESPEEETYRKHLRTALAESFLAAATADDDLLFDGNAYQPFDEKYRIKSDEAPDHAFYGRFFRNNYGVEEDDGRAWRRIDDDWLMMAGELALNIDGITNNTCLALAIELIESKKVFIFPGDAQFGNWNSWKKLKWQVPDSEGQKELNVNDLLKRTVLYKVGHHGSHNATMKKSGLELMDSPELVALIPTNQKFALSKITERTPNGWKMPEKELLEALEKRSKGRVILADEAGIEGDEHKPLKARCTGSGLSKAKTEKFLGRVEFESPFTLVRDSDFPDEKEPLWVQYTIEV